MIVAVTGLKREARVLAGSDSLTVVGGGDRDALKARIEAALNSGARRVLSIGICGALSSSLKVGDCIVATAIMTETEHLPTDANWSTELLAQVPSARPAILAGSDSIVANTHDRARLQLATDAAAADMESHIAARVAAARRLPFAALRVVSDSCDQTLPPAALVAMAQNGKVDLAAVLRSVLGDPRQIPALMRTAWEAEKAFRALFRCRHVLDPGLVVADLGELALDVG